MSPATAALSAALESSVAYGMADTVSRLTSPYALGPFYSNPLSPIVEAFDYDTVCAMDGPRLFVGATNVRTGKVRIFTGDQISTGAILASACLPTLFQAVEIADPEYNDLMAAAQRFIDAPGAADVPVDEVFTDAMFEELRASMAALAADANGVCTEDGSSSSPDTAEEPDDGARAGPAIALCLVAGRRRLLRSKEAAPNKALH